MPLALIFDLESRLFGIALGLFVGSLVTWVLTRWRLAKARRSVLRGDAGDNLLSGYGGNDRLRGRQGPDLLLGSGGSDVGRGGKGADTCVQVETRISCAAG